MINWFWDTWCVCSLIGIWPRFIEPNLLSVNKLDVSIDGLCSGLSGLKILQLSDLHWDAHFSDAFKQKILFKIEQLQPDLIIFTGDFLIQSRLEKPESLLQFLNSLKAKYGCYAVLGNHDYANYVTINATGDYDVPDQHATTHISNGFKRLFNSVALTKKISQKAQQTQIHEKLVDLLKHSPFRLLHNSSELLSINGCQLNICGVGEYTLGRSLPDEAFKNYNKDYPGIVLAHNPDSIPALLNYPGELILSGHTHGGQINLPIIWKKFTRLENPQFKRGLKKIAGKMIYINRGVGSGLQFRWFSPPELTLFTLVNA